MNERVAKRNLRLLLIYRSMQPLHFLTPVILLYAKEKEVTQAQFLTVHAIFSATLIVCGVPAGRFADRNGYKKSLVVGSGLVVGGYACYNFDGVVAFGVASLISGIGFAFTGGAYLAIAHDTLSAIGREHEYPKFETRVIGIFGLLGAGVGIASSYIAAADMDLLGIAQVMMTGFFAVLVLFLVEPPRQLSECKPLRPGVWQAFKEMGGVMNYALHHHARLRWLILFSAIMGTTTLITLFLAQAYARELGLSVRGVGVLWSVQLLVVAAVALLVAVRFAAMRRDKAFGILACVMVTVLIGMVVGESIPLLFLLLGGYSLVLGMLNTVVNSAVQKEIDRSGVRATVISIQNVADDVVYIVLGPTIGLLADSYSVRTALLVMAVTCGSLSAVALLGLSRNRRVEDVCVPASQ